MTWKQAIGVLLVALTFAVGCATPYWYDQQRKLAQERDSEKISERDYRERLKQSRDSLPAEMQGGWEDPKPAIHGTINVP